MSESITLPANPTIAFYLIKGALELAADAIRYTIRNRDEYIDTIIRLIEWAGSSSERLLMGGKVEAAVKRIKVVSALLETIKNEFGIPLDYAIEMINSALPVLESLQTNPPPTKVVTS